MDGGSTAQSSWLRRIGWLVLIWTASVCALALVALALRALMGLAGLTT
jgi:hypothetical protein